MPGIDYNDFASIRFSSTLNNGELNLRRRVLMRPGSYEASFLVGGRYLQIGDEFGYPTQSSTGGISTNEMTVDTGNSLWGAQVGLLSQFLVQPKCWIDFEMKGGIFTNRASLTRTYIGPAAPAGVVGTDEQDRTSFVGDLSLQFNYQLRRLGRFTRATTPCGSRASRPAQRILNRPFPC